MKFLSGETKMNSSGPWANCQLLNKEKFARGDEHGILAQQILLVEDIFYEKQ